MSGFTVVTLLTAVFYIVNVTVWLPLWHIVPSIDRDDGRTTVVFTFRRFCVLTSVPEDLESVISISVMVNSAILFRNTNC